MIKFLKIFIIISVGAFSNSSLSVTESQDFKLKALVRNSELGEAKKILKKIDPRSEVFYRIQGQILTKEEKYREANKFLNKAYKMKPSDQTLYLMAQNSLKIKEPLKTVSLLKKTKKDTVPVRLMLSQAYWELDKKEKALEVVFTRGFESNELLEKQKYNFLIKSSRISKLFEIVESYLESYPKKVEPVLFAVALLKEKDLFLSEKVFDLAIVKSPKSALLLKERGAFELELNRPKVAASYFVRAAHLSKEYSYEASVTKLLLGEHYEALFHAHNIKDHAKRLKQKFFIYLDQERFEEVVSLREQLVMQNLFKEEKITYAFLYAAFKTKDTKTFNDIFSSYQLKAQLSKVMKLKSLLEKCSKSVELECVFS